MPLLGAAMAYVFDLEEVDPEIFVDNQGSEIVEFVLGYDLDDELVIVMSVMLIPCGEACDLRFGIREKDLNKDWKVSGLCYDRERVRECIPSQARDIILVYICLAVGALASATQYEKITMETYYRNLPSQAMQKYESISNQLISNGFSVETSFRNDDGIDYWLFVK